MAVKETVVAEAASAEERTAPASAGDRMLGALRHSRDYRVYWAGNQASSIMMQMQQVANGYLAYTLTHSATTLGIVSLASGLSTLLLAPLGGVVADRLPRRNVLIVSQSLLCVVALILGVLVQTGLIQWWHLLISGALEGSFFAFMMPARQAFIPSLVDDSDLLNAIAINNAGFNASRILGPAVAGLLIATPFIGVKGIYFFRAVAYTGVLVSLLKISVNDRPSKQGRRPFVQDLSSGLTYIARNERLLPLFLLAAIVVTFGMGYQVLLPVFALSVLKTGARGLGFLSTAAGVGALLGSLTVAYFSEAQNKARMQTLAGIGVGLGIIAFCFSAGAGLYLAALACLLIVGLSNDFYSTLNNTLIMTNTDRALYGRVMSVYMMTWGIVPMVGAGIAAAADHIGAPLALGGAGIVVGLVSLGVSLFYPAYRRVG
ncbi:MAG: MFS transporter [Dehalococcoidia bacterium]